MKTPAATEHPPSTRFAAAALVTAALALALALPAASSAAQTLSVQKAGAGTGQVASFPAGINCGPTCSAPFAEGATVSLIAASGPSTDPLAQWAGCDSVNGENKCIVTISSARTVTATFNLLRHPLTVTKAGSGTGTVTSSPAGINCGPTCAADFDHSATVTLSGAAGANTEAVKWSGCNSLDGENRCLVTISGARNVTATFDLKRRLTVTKAGSGSGSVSGSPAGIECGASCSALYDLGTSVTLSGARGLHTQAVKWTGCDEVISGNKCVVAMSADKAVSASFELEPGAVLYNVTVEKTGTGAGTVSGSPGSIECGATCSAELVEGTTLTLSASAAPGSVFAHWSGGGCAGSGPCTTTVKAAKTVKAVFTAVGTRTLTVAKVGTGSGTVTSKAAGIECGETCSAQVPAGKKVTLSAKAAAGSAFAHWSGACAGAGTCTVTMSEARDVTASFSAPPPPPCLVPRLAGKSPSKARAALAAAHCALGKVSRPKARKGTKLGPLVVKSSSPGAGATLPAGGKVDLRLRPAAKKHGRAHKRRHG